MEKKRETINDYAKNKREHHEKKHDKYMERLKEEHQKQGNNDK